MLIRSFYYIISRIGVVFRQIYYYIERIGPSRASISYIAKFQQLIYYIVGETSRYLTTLVATPIIRISFYLRISYLFSLFSIVKTIEPNLVYRLYLFSLDIIYLGYPYILIGLKVSISSFRSLKPLSSRKGRVGIPWATI